METSRCYLGNLYFQVTDSAIRTLLQSHGFQVRNIQIVRKGTWLGGHPMCSAFVTLDTDSEVQRLAQMLNGWPCEMLSPTVMKAEKAVPRMAWLNKSPRLKAAFAEEEAKEDDYQEKTEPKNEEGQPVETEPKDEQEQPVETEPKDEQEQPVETEAGDEEEQQAKTEAKDEEEQPVHDATSATTSPASTRKRKATSSSRSSKSSKAKAKSSGRSRRAKSSSSRARSTSSSRGHKKKVKSAGRKKNRGRSRRS